MVFDIFKIYIFFNFKFLKRLYIERNIIIYLYYFVVVINILNINIIIYLVWNEIKGIY